MRTILPTSMAPMISSLSRALLPRPRSSPIARASLPIGLHSIIVPDYNGISNTAAQPEIAWTVVPFDSATAFSLDARPLGTGVTVIQEDPEQTQSTAHPLSRCPIPPGPLPHQRTISPFKTVAWSSLNFMAIRLAPSQLSRKYPLYHFSNFGTGGIPGILGIVAGFILNLLSYFAGFVMSSPSVDLQVKLQVSHLYTSQRLSTGAFTSKLAVLESHLGQIMLFPLVHRSFQAFKPELCLFRNLQELRFPP